MIRFDLRDFEKELEGWEAFRAKPYLDSKGIPTIAIGATVWNGEPVHMEMPKVSYAEAIAHLRKDAWVAILDAQDYATRRIWNTLTGARQMVLANMSFQLGGPRLGTFVESRKFLHRRDWNGFAAEILDSKWHRDDTPRRALTMSTRFKENRYQ